MRQCLIIILSCFILLIPCHAEIQILRGGEEIAADVISRATPSQPEVTAADVPDLSTIKETSMDANNAFGFDLYSRLSEKDGNIFFSPYSIFTALNMTYEGAMGNTRDEMAGVLRIPSDDIKRREEITSLIQNINVKNKSYELNTANAIWAQAEFHFENSFLEFISDVYSGEARNLDFITDPDASRVIVNEWVTQKTKDRIKDLLPEGSVNAGTRLILTNAIYFKGSWTKVFNPKNTREDVFWLSNDRTMNAKYMELKDESFNYEENADVQILELLYKGNDLSMFILLPKDKNIKALESKLSESNINLWLSKMGWEQVNIFIPKFRLEFDKELKNILIDMGMVSAFGFDADFSGMTGGKDLLIDEVFHKAWIDVNEEGTEAAAATGVVMRELSMRIPSEPKIFRADHPFIFIIKDSRTNNILFLGRINEPESI